ncbi:DNA topoisomerase III [Salmonella enterica]|uniref:DNA topoisomerase n=1 Tax=Salmonella enterica I TaxID=59201 RepID=F2Q903_SALET|nr:DNA topoisomerase III [Salmonella enterica]CAX68099.1 DNA topoisomerase [Salmonella enterica subsp. enterica] [Salmonella enterica subsp. enterica serovar Senftenberg]HAB1649588.1 DNA topoisomerase III [Salmonella enterica subsp. enterica]EBY8686105.1 DNA topoisomerase III [Salmonella enterica subsp. enterica serovar Agona]EHW1979585.1 DNA topoisomerase III [Salmonella enterica subsp. enterica serovar Agona]EKG5014813.1 DNA topoisomerase III [Salmonella enterica]
MRLFICEKPSQGRDLAGVLGATRRGDGYLSGQGVVVTWAVGHLLETAPPEAYGQQYAGQWTINSLPILPSPWQVVVKKETRDQFKVIEKLLKQVDDVVIATDADREGEVIARELLDYCGWNGPVQRLWLSALDETSIRAALSDLRPGAETLGMYYAGLGRARADWLVGMNLTRLYTLLAADTGYHGMVSVGRVQTPTLALVVRRDREIAAFVPRPYWQVKAMLSAGGVTFPAQWVPAKVYTDEEKRCVHKNIAQQVAQLCRQAGASRVTECETKREKASAPLAYSLGTLQQDCGRLWNMSPQQVLDTAQSLYEKHKATTYPRTDCGYLPESMREDIPAVLGAIRKTDPDISSLLSQLDTGFVSVIWNDKKITAHHGIIPTRNAVQLSAMTETERQVYLLIRRNYLAQFLPLHESDMTRLSLDIGGQLFRTSGRVEVVKGWKVLFEKEQDEQKEGDDEATVPLPVLRKDDTCAVTGAEVVQLMTRPPAHYTFATLIKAMMNAASYVTDLTLRKVLKDNAGLGTEATRAGIIDLLLKREFIVRKGSQLRATELACDIIDALPVQLTDPGMTALWEQALDEVAAGRMQLDDFLQRQMSWTRQLVSAGSQQKVNLRVPPSPPCPVCGGKMRQRKGDRGAFWGCLRYPECKGVIGHTGAKSGARRQSRGRAKSVKS